MPDIWFPYLGIEIDHLNKTAFHIGNFSVAWYGIIIAIGVLAGWLLARHLAKISGQKPEFYTDLLIYGIIFAIIGARIYYVIFRWDLYKDNPLSIFNLRNGGLGIYGGVIAAVITAIVYSHVHHQSTWKTLDTALPGMILGQAIGRWGNFFNQEAFGSYTDNIFAMRLNVETAAYTTPELLKHAITKGGVRYIQVHPTFLYESFFCLVILAVMLILFHHRKFEGEVACTYMIGYGTVRAFIETLRTDQLLLWNTNFPVSVLTSIAFAAFGTIMMIVLGVRASRAKAAAAPDRHSYAPEIDPDEDADLEGLEKEDLAMGEEEETKDEILEETKDPEQAIEESAEETPQEEDIKGEDREEEVREDSGKEAGDHEETDQTAGQKEDSSTQMEKDDFWKL